MKASELIEQLQVCLEEHGDWTVEVRNGNGDFDDIDDVEGITANQKREVLRIY